MRHSLFVALAQRAGYATFAPRSYSSLGLLGRLDGNVAGGLLQGVGMALSGSCAGTVFAQTGAGLSTGFYTLSGGLLGGALWSSTVRPLCRRSSIRHAAAVAKSPVPPPLAIDERLGVSRTTALVAFEALAAAAVGAVALPASARTRGLVNPVAGGALIGLAQLVSIATRKTMLGTSTSFEEFGDYMCWLARRAGGGGAGGSRPPSYKNMAFVAAMALGAFVVSWASPQARAAAVPVAIRPFRSVLGGALIAVGSRIGGGCTSGHGISGISLLSVSSFVTVACMFTGGIGTALALRS